MPGLWKSLDFSTAKKPVSLGAVKNYVKRGNGTTTRVTLDKFGCHKEKIPRYVATRCRGLIELSIPGGVIGASILEAAPCASSLKTLIISKACEISCDVVSQLLNSCPNLERADFHSVNSAGRFSVRWDTDMRNLRTLTLDTPKSRGTGNAILQLSTLLTRIPDIQTLSIQGWAVPPYFPGLTLDFSKLHRLQELNISRLQAVLPPRLPPTISRIAMAECINFPQLQGRISFTDYELPQLVRLSLAGFFQLSLADLQACLIASKGKVTHLDIGGCIDLSSVDLKELITQGYLEGVEDLVLKSCNVDDEIAMLIARNLPHLKNLDLARTKITGVGVKALVVGLEAKLEHLCLDECHSTNIDAVTLARGMGVKVAFGFSDTLSKGRRIKQL